MLPLFFIAIFSGAGLLFLVQPMIAKQLLPQLGGSPAVWNVCMVFFQVTLLGGYLYAHLLARLRAPRTQLIVHGVVVLAAVFTLPIGLGADARPSADGSPTLWVLLTLIASVGAPFFVLASASPLLQRWFATTGHKWAADPYFLYAGSNLGSMLALLGYPLFFEPTLALQSQLTSWSWGFGVFGALALACGFLVVRGNDSQGAGAGDTPSPGDGSAVTGLETSTRLKWIGLAFVPSSLMLGVTQHVSTDIATTPVLWIVPLAIYLLTFIIVFTRWGQPVIRWSRFLVPVAALIVGGLLAANLAGAIVAQVILHMLALLVFGLACHGRLAETRPHAMHLTEFYLLMSVGGALGGIFNALLAPVVFDGIAEYPIAIIIGCLLCYRAHGQVAGGRSGSENSHGPVGVDGWIAGMTAVVLVVALAFAGSALHSYMGLAQYYGDINSSQVLKALPAIGCLLLIRWRWPFMCGLIAVFVTPPLVSGDEVAYRQRTFFGVHRIVEVKDGGGYWHNLWHGSTRHGCQYSKEPWASYPTMYYTKSGPVGDVMRVLEESPGTKHLALVGLGVGTIAAYGRPDWRMTYYEIDPEVKRIAEDPKHYTYLSQSKSKIDVVIGDARLKLSQTKDTYDTILLDAFSSDSIPVHLLTRQAVELYLTRLNPEGVLAIHITNRHLNLYPVVANIAADLQLFAAVRYDSEISDDDRRLRRKSTSDWIVLSKTRTALGSIEQDREWKWMKPDPATIRRTWTDDYSHVLGILRD